MKLIDVDAAERVLPRTFGSSGAAAARPSEIFGSSKSRTPTPTMSKKIPMELVSTTQMCTAFGIGERWLRQLSDQGVMRKISYGVWDLPTSIQEYVKWRIESELKHAPLPPGSSKDDFERERARKLKLENDQREALLIQTPDALAAIDHIVGDIRTALAGIPARFTQNLEERRRLENEIDNVLEQLADRFAHASACLAAGEDPFETLCASA